MSRDHSISPYLSGLEAISTQIRHIWSSTSFVLSLYWAGQHRLKTTVMASDLPLFHFRLPSLRPARNKKEVQFLVSSRFWWLKCRVQSYQWLLGGSRLSPQPLRKQNWEESVPLFATSSHSPDLNATITKIIWQGKWKIEPWEDRPIKWTSKPVCAGMGYLPEVTLWDTENYKHCREQVNQQGLHCQYLIGVYWGRERWLSG